MFIISSPQSLTVCQAFSSPNPSRSSSVKPIWWSNTVPPQPSFLHTHTSCPLLLPLALSLPLRPPFFHLPCPCLFLSGWPSLRGYRVLTCLHLPPALADQWGCCTKSPSFSAPPFSQSQLKLSVFSTSDPRPWQQGQECQEWLAG